MDMEAVFGEKELSEYITWAQKNSDVIYTTREGSALRALMDFLPEDKLLTAERLQNFFAMLENTGVSTVSQRRYKRFVNHVIDYFGYDGLRLAKKRGVQLCPATPEKTSCSAESAAEGFVVTESMIDDYLDEAKKSADRKYNRREKTHLSNLFSFLPPDKILSKERLEQFQNALDATGISKETQYDYSITVNHFLDRCGHPEMKREKGLRQDLTGQKFGELLVLEKTDRQEVKYNRKACFYWKCLCSCGNIVEVPTNQLTCGNVTSCGHRKNVSYLQEAQVFIDHTCVRNVLDGRTYSSNASGRRGVGWDAARKKWTAYIQYKKVSYSLGRYHNLNDAIKAREIAENYVKDDAVGLLEEYISERGENKVPLSVLKMAKKNGICLGDSETDLSADNSQASDQSTELIPATLNMA